MARVLIACEFSGVVRRAFRERGHEAYSCDLLDAADGSPHHYKADAVEVAYGEHWDLLIAHPPCTHLARSGARYFAEKRADGRQQQAVEFFMDLANADHIPRRCLEQPIGIMSKLWRPYDQMIQPYEFGHGEVKSTCLWLVCLPKLEPTCVVQGRSQRLYMLSPSAARAAERSTTYEGIAQAMAGQWGPLLHQPPLRQQML